MTLRYSNTKFLTILDPFPLEGIGWEAVAYDVDATGGLTVMQRVYRFHELSGSKVRNDFGSGTLVIPKDDALWDEDLPTPRTGTNPLNREFLWRLYEDGILRHEFFGEDIEEDIAVDAESIRYVKVSGRTPEACLSWGVHAPAWAETQTVRISAEATSGSFILGYGSKKTAPIAYNASAAAFKAAVLSGVSGLSPLDLEVSVAVEDGQRVWSIRFVGQFITHNLMPPGFRPSSSTVADGDAKYHPSCSDIGQVDYYATDKPRTAARVFLDCLSRCQARGILKFVTPLFSATVDSYGEAWTDLDAHEVNGGETLLSLLQRFSEAYGWEFRMLPGFRLQVVQAGFGVDRSDTARFWLGAHQINHTLSRTSREVLTRVWAQTDTNLIAQSVGSSSVSSLAREGWVDGFSGSAGYAQRVANETLKMFSKQAKQRTVKLPYNVKGGPRLFEDFNYCDFIGIEDDRNTMRTLKVDSVAWKVGPESPIDLEVTFSGE